MNALVNADGKLLVKSGKVATDECDPAGCCVHGGCCLPRVFNGTWQSRDRAFQNCSDEPSQAACEALGGTWWTAFFDPNTSPPPICDNPFGGLTQFLLCCDSTPDLDVTNCFNSVSISASLSFSVTDDPVTPTGCTEFSGSVSLSKMFTRVAVNPGNQPADGNFYAATNGDACGWGIRGPFGGDFIISQDVNDQACGTPGTATFSVDVNLAPNFMIASFASTIACGDGACLFNPNGGSPISLGEFAFDSCTLGTHTFTASDSTDRFSYNLSVSVTLS